MIHQVCKDCHDTVQSFLSKDSPLINTTKTKLDESIKIFKQLLNSNTLDTISLSFNGGKDCLVLLIIYLSTLYEVYGDTLRSIGSINCILINYETQFPQLTSFINECIEKYHLDLIQYNMPMKQGFETYLKEHPQIKSIVIGQRRSDPFSSNLKPFQKTDNNWPEFERVHPMLDWKYNEVWCFLRTSSIDYCCLYDLGYTSLGGISNTLKNPHLKTPDGYKSAYELTERSDELEREGRNK